jgi:hypothetical protein
MAKVWLIMEESALPLSKANQTQIVGLALSGHDGRVRPRYSWDHRECPSGVLVQVLHAGRMRIMPNLPPQLSKASNGSLFHATSLGVKPQQLTRTWYQRRIEVAASLVEGQWTSSSSRGMLSILDARSFAKIDCNRAGPAPTVVESLTFAVHLGEAYRRVGPAQTGKTVKLRVSTGCVRPSTGKVFVKGHSSGARREATYRASVLGADAHDLRIGAATCLSILLLDESTRVLDDAERRALNATWPRLLMTASRYSIMGEC